MTTTLIEPSEVVEFAFNAGDTGIIEHISQANILACETRFLQPVFGDIYTALTHGEHSEFNQNYIKPALALYLKATILPFLGTVQAPLGMTYEATHQDLEIDDERLAQLCELSLRDAKALIIRAINYIKTHREEFNESKNLDKICSTMFLGGIIL